jgi:hypothetical protein
MKKSLIISAVALLLSVTASAQKAETKPAERKAPTMEQIAQRRADWQRKALGLDDAQHKKLYKFYLKEVKQQKARMEQIKKQEQKKESQLKKILTEEQWAKYQKIQKRRNAASRKFMYNAMHRHHKPAVHKDKCPTVQKGPKIERPQGKNTSMYIDKGEVK